MLHKVRQLRLTSRLWTTAACLTAACALLAATPSIAAASPAHVLDSRVQSIIAKNKMTNAEVGVCIVDVETGEMIASVNERKKLTPASNLKLLTSGAALAVLGPDFKFRTTIHIDGTRVVITGSGDPALGDPELLKRGNLSTDAFLASIVKPIVDANVKGITEVIVDDRVFDREAVHPSWHRRYASRWYSAQVSGLNFNTNVLEVWPKPGAPGEPALITKCPDAPWIEIINKTRTIKGSATALGLDRVGGENRFTFTGTIFVAPTEPISATLSEPALVFGRLIADRLVAAGMTATAPPPAESESSGLTVRLANPTEKFEFTAPPVLVIETPITVALSRCNVNSQNLYAECLLKALGNKVTGQPGSWSNGSAVVRMQVTQRVGIDAGELHMVDGSGLSEENAVSPALLSLWIASIARDKSFGEIFVNSLPSPGDGSLEKRFSKKPALPIKGKSGYISGVQCLSGFITNPATGRRLAYSVMINRTEMAQGSPKETHEDIVRDAAEWLAAQPARAKPAGK